MLCEALDRLSRFQADVAALFEDFRFHGVKIRTISEGDISELQIG
ncbi:recombinase family protein [uncultured Brevundimonas sp.]